MREPALPLIIVDGNDVMTFESADAASRWLEVVDVAAGIYKGYDADGRALMLSVDDGTTSTARSPVGARAPVAVALAEDIPRHAEELRSILRRHLAAIRSPDHADDGDISTEEARLPDLVSALQRVRR